MEFSQANITSTNPGYVPVHADIQATLAKHGFVCTGGSTHALRAATATLAKRGKGKKIKMPKGVQDQIAAEKRASMTWAQRLKRVFDIDKVN